MAVICFFVVFPLCRCSGGCVSSSVKSSSILPGSVTAALSPHPSLPLLLLWKEKRWEKPHRPLKHLLPKCDVTYTLTFIWVSLFSCHLPLQLDISICFSFALYFFFLLSPPVFLFLSGCRMSRDSSPVLSGAGASSPQSSGKDYAIPQAHTHSHSELQCIFYY